MSLSESLETYRCVDDWIVVAPNRRITVRTGKVDIGQRISTALALIAAEELDVDFSRIDVETVDTATSLDEEYTSASNSIERSGNAVAAATARGRLLELASGTLGVERSSLQVDDGLVTSLATNRSITYWELMEGLPFAVAIDPAVPLKPPHQYRQIGRQVLAKDLIELVRGGAPFVHDMHMPEMLHARLVRPPHYHARVATIDETIYSRLDGGYLLRDGSFVAVAAEDEFRAIRLAQRVALAIRWSPERGLDARDVFQRLTAEPSVSLPERRGGFRRTRSTV